MHHHHKTEHRRLKHKVPVKSYASHHKHHELRHNHHHHHNHSRKLQTEEPEELGENSLMKASIDYPTMGMVNLENGEYVLKIN